MTTRRARLLSEERLPYLTGRERQALARFQRFLQEQGFGLPQGEA